MQLAGWNLQTRSYGNYGIFILSINGATQSTSTGAYWQWYDWSGTRWILGPVGASSYVLKNGDMLLWYLAPVTAGPPPAP